MIWEMAHPTAGKVRTIGNPIVFADTTLGEPVPPPRLGEHTEAVLADIGYDLEEISEMKNNAAI